MVEHKLITKIVDVSDYKIGAKFNFIIKDNPRISTMNSSHYAIIKETQVTYYDRLSNPGFYIDIYTKKDKLVKSNEFGLIYRTGSTYSGSYSPELCYLEPDYNIDDILNNLQILEQNIK